MPTSMDIIMNLYAVVTRLAELSQFCISSTSLVDNMVLTPSLYHAFKSGSNLSNF